MRFFKHRHHASSIGIIGGADGPTAIFIASKKTNKRGEEFQKFLSQAQQQIQPCEHSFSQLETYLKETHHAIPYKLSHGELESLKVNVLLNHYPHLLEEIPVPEGLSEFEIPFYRAHSFPVERIDFHPKAFTLPDAVSMPSPPTRKFLWRRHKPASSEMPPAVVQWEETSGYLCINHGDDTIMNEIQLFLGVSQQDIQEKSPRFIAYAYALNKLKK